MARSLGGRHLVPSARVARSWGRLRADVEARARRATRWVRSRRHPPLARPPATAVALEHHPHGVLELRLEGGERRNVLGRSTITAIEETIADPPAGTRVVVITAEPPDFCAGYDLVEALHEDAEALIAHPGNFAPLRTSKVPIVVALSGNVIGGGLELALLGDVRVASPDVRLAIPASRLGLVYSAAGVQLVVEAFGPSVARSMFLAGVVVDAESALARGVVATIVSRDQLRDEALHLARDIATWSATATSGNRQVLDVVAGRATWDVDDLRSASFDPHGDLAREVRDFASRRAASDRPA